MRTSRYINQSILKTVGGAYGVARVLGISVTAVYQWHGVVPESRIDDFCRIFGILPDAVRESNARMVQQKDAPRPVAKVPKVSTRRKGFTQISTQELQALKTLASLYLKIHSDRTEVDQTSRNCGTSREMDARDKERIYPDFNIVHETQVCGTKGMGTPITGEDTA
jgi:hypothetical protein